MIQHNGNTFKPNFADRAAAIRRLKLLHLAVSTNHRQEMLRRALTETDEQVLANPLMPERPQDKALYEKRKAALLASQSDEPVPESEASEVA